MQVTILLETQTSKEHVKLKNHDRSIAFKRSVTNNGGLKLNLLDPKEKKIIFDLTQIKKIYSHE